MERSASATAAFDAGLGALKQLLPELPDERHYIHSDLLYHNVLVDGNHISAVLDWGNALYEPRAQRREGTRAGSARRGHRVRPEQAFWRVHDGLPRQGPGSDATTLALLDMADPQRVAETAIDMGCGPGRASLALAAAGLDVLAVDTHEPFLRELSAAAASAGLSDRIAVRAQSMRDLDDLPNASFDLVWAEGTAYLMGWPKALRQWRRLLTPAGRLVVTDTFWLTGKPSSEAEALFANDSVVTVDTAVEVAKGLGYDIVGRHLQPDSDWIAEYYAPLSLDAPLIVDVVRRVLGQMPCAAGSLVLLRDRIVAQEGASAGCEHRMS